MRQSIKSRSSKGFTLVELSIVLVIIGLIIASVLVGQDLIRQGELRATITQFEQYISAVGTFRAKYGNMPGDIEGSAFFSSTAAQDDEGAAGNNFQDGLLVAPTGSLIAGGENVLFWSQLGSAGAALISGSYNGASVSNANVADNLPAVKSGGFWGVFSNAGANYLYIGAVGSTTAGDYDVTASLTPLEALSIDTKVDDAKPTNGVAQSYFTGADDPLNRGGTYNAGGGVLDATQGCIYTDATTGDQYNTIFGSNACTMAIRLAVR